MKKLCCFFPLIILITLFITGCNLIGQKNMSISIIYAITSIFSLLLLFGYVCFSRKKDIWFILLLSYVFVVNAGYFSLSVSSELGEALLANRISYLGSVFLPLSMQILILNACNIKTKKWFTILLVCVGFAIFLIAASPGYLDIYYKSVSLAFVDGVTVLEKVYGPLHSVYLYYLVAYFASMSAIIIYSTIKKKIESNTNALILLVSVFINIGVWLIEQLVHINFEFLSVSYIISVLFMLCIFSISTEKQSNSGFTTYDTDNTTSPTTDSDTEAITDYLSPEYDKTQEHKQTIEKFEYFVSQLDSLTPTERTIYNLYLKKMSTKEILITLNIKENTLKYHNKNIYSKLGVSSRKQLFEIATTINQNDC